jgi:hypothetical protein
MSQFLCMVTLYRVFCPSWARRWHTIGHCVGASAIAVVLRTTSPAGRSQLESGVAGRAPLLYGLN